MTIRLSICIPTYNRSKYLPETLNSIVSQLTDEVELVISDNASSDNTHDLIEKFIRNNRGISYFRHEKNVGADLNYLKAVQLGTGDYCWLFGSDDVMEKGAINYVLNRIKTGDDIYLCGFTECTIDMKPIHKHVMTTARDGSIFDLAIENEREVYFKSAITSSAFFSFIGSLIIKKSKWEKSIDEVNFIGSLWSHVGKVFGILPFGLRVNIIEESLLQKRGGNDSFLNDGLVNRYRIAIEGYHHLGTFFFGKRSREAFHMRRVVRNELSLRALMGAKYDCQLNGDKENVLILNSLAKRHYFDWPLTNYINFIVLRYMPKRLYSASKFISRILRGL